MAICAQVMYCDFSILQMILAAHKSIKQTG